MLNLSKQRHVNSTKSKDLTLDPSLKPLAYHK